MAGNHSVSDLKGSSFDVGTDSLAVVTPGVSAGITKADDAYDVLRGGSKLAGKGDEVIQLTQFSKSTIDDAVEYAATPRKLEHLFDAKHNLGSLVDQFGSQQNAVRNVLNAANGRLPSRGVFNDLPVRVGKHTVHISGMVPNGVPKIGTMYIR